MKEVGWYEDPYGIHEARWISDGAPTALVRDGRRESQDEPPPGTGYLGPLVAVAQVEPPNTETAKGRKAARGLFHHGGRRSTSSGASTS